MVLYESTTVGAARVRATGRDEVTYSDRAVVERWRRGIDDDSALGLGVLVDEAVQTPQVSGRTDLRVSSFSISGRMLSQPGARIDDPSRTASPEDMDLYINGAAVYPTLLTHSPLLGDGVYALDFTDDYEALGGAFEVAVDHRRLRHGRVESDHAGRRR